ncbi:MAG: 4-(cytidine 5'-diphospho)-2-C-methyl-D-erythritol kinase, partial [Desulfobulbaceae bacterium]|nr:4-(cytidine 5'-diphospho)-2-C-methyl-D-erythritol kinase [Desulfobulbaceae bacterium]
MTDTFGFFMSRKGIYIKAPAKINLYLRVIGRRPDGYHLLATLMQKLSLYDRLEIEKTAGCEVNLECPDSDLPVNDENIVLRAALLFHSSLQDRLPDNFGVRIILRKKIPVAAGLGGGSSDAAAMLIGLDRLFRTGCSKQELARLGLQLGADVPFFIYDRPVAWATGIGEELTEAQGLEDGSVLLVNPGFPVSTKWVYENLPLTLKQKDFNLTDTHSHSDDCRV